MGAAWAGQTRAVADIISLSSVVTLSSDGKRGAEPPTGSGDKNDVMSDCRETRAGGPKCSACFHCIVKVNKTLAVWLDQN